MVTISKKQVSKTSIFELPRVKNCISRLCTGPFTHVTHSWWRQPFRVFGTGFDRPWAGLETAKNVLSYPSRHILSQHPHSHPSEWVARGHRGPQNRQHSKNGEKMHKLHQRSSHSAPYKPHGVGTRKHFFGSESKKNQKIHDFRPKKRGGHLLIPPHHLPQNLKKVGFKWGGPGGGGGSRTKNSLGDAFIGQNNDFTRG